MLEDCNHFRPKINPKSARIDRTVNKRVVSLGRDGERESVASLVADETNITDDSEEMNNNAKEHRKLKLDRFNHLYLKGLESKLKT